MKRKGIFYKVLCAVLAVTVFAVGIPFTVIAASTDEANFAVLSDIHYFAESQQGPTSADKQEFHEIMLLDNSTSGISPELTEAALKNLELMANSGEIDFVLVPGDLTKNGEKAGHIELANRLRAFETATGIPVYVINGNHDINNPRASFYSGDELINCKKMSDTDKAVYCTSSAEFETIYADFGYTPESGYYNRYKPAANNTEGCLSYATDINDEYRLIAIDSQMYSADNTASGLDEQETAGQMSESLREWAVNECEKAKADGKTVIGLTHTNFVPHFETETDLFDNFVLTEWERIADELADAGMHFAVSGHVHMQDMATYINDNGESIIDIVSTSILSYPNQFRTVSIKKTAAGKYTMNYKTHDVDEVVPVVINGVAQPKPFKYQTWKYNFGGDNIKNFILNLLEYQLKYGFGKDVEKAGGLYAYLNENIDMQALLTELTNSEILGGISSVAAKALLISVCNQIDRKYLQNPDETIATLEPMIDEILAVEVSDYPCTKFKDTLGFQSAGDKGTVGDLASTVLAYHCANDEKPEDDQFLMSALERFDNGQNAENLVDTLLKVILDDLLQGTILKDIKIDPISIGSTGIGGDIVSGIIDSVNGIIGAGGDWDGIGIGDIISIILMSGVVGGDTLSDVVYSALDEYLTKSQYDIIDAEFYRVLKDLTHDSNPAPLADLNGTFTYSGRVNVPLSAENLRLPSNIAITFGEDSKTSLNISYFTKYSITNTDIQIVPYSSNPDFSNGTTVNANIRTGCENDVFREYASIDLSFIGILYHEIYVNRHTVEITGLEPGTKYCYRVGDASRGWWSDTGVINTADGSSTYGFFHVTDPQSVTEKQYAQNWASALDTAFSNHKDAGFILSTGDMVDNGKDFREWQRMFNAASNSLMDTVLMTASGNHEARGDNANIQNFIYSNLPAQDTTSGVYYSFDYNTAHIAVLNTNNLAEDKSLSADQIEWLKADMSASNADWKFIALHKAPYSNGSHFDDEDVVAIRAQLVPLMNELDIDIMFQGHDHVYMRTGVLKDNAVVKTEEKKVTYNGLEYTAKVDPDGTIYSINGTAGPKHYEPKPAAETEELIPSGETVLYVQVPAYSYIQIDGGNLYFDSYAVDGGNETRIDSFAIIKPVNSTNNPGSGSGENGNNGSDNNKGSGIGNIIDDISNTSAAARGIIIAAAVAVLALTVSYCVMTAIVAKRRREEM